MLTPPLGYIITDYSRLSRTPLSGPNRGFASARPSSMDEFSGHGSRNNRNTNTSRRPPPTPRGELSSRVSLPSHSAARGSQTPSQPSLDTYSQQSTSRSSSNQSPSSPFDDAMSRHAGSGPTTVATSRPQQYQLVSPGTPVDPRTMSQVSPGFIFVIFPMFAGVV